MSGGKVRTFLQPEQAGDVVANLFHLETKGDCFHFPGTLLLEVTAAVLWSLFFAPFNL